MSGIVLVHNNSRAGITNIRRGDFVIAAGRADGIYRLHLVVVGGVTSRRSVKIIKCPAYLGSGHRREQSLTAGRYTSQYLISGDRRVAGVRFRPGEMDRPAHS